MNSPSKSEWVIGLFRYSESSPPTTSFAKFFASVTELLGRWGLSIAYMGAEGTGYTGKLVKASSPTAKRLVNTGFQNITTLALVTNPEGSNTPAFDRVFSASLSWNSSTENLLCFTVNDAIAPFLSEAYEEALTLLVSLDKWEFGYSFRDAVVRQPDFHVMGLDNRRLSESEHSALRRWYAARPTERLQKLRSLYPVTITNVQQNDRRVGGETLEQFLKKTPGVTFVKSGDLTIWRVPENVKQPLQMKLATAGVSIT